MKFSIIIAVYNGAATLQRCIDSIAAQTCSDYELILIDGASTDGTLDIIDDNRSRFSYWESEPDRGIYHAWNKALAHARGEWLYFLGADDYLWSERTLEQLSMRLEHVPPAYRVVYGRVALVNRAGETFSVAGRPWPKIRRAFRQVMLLPHQGVMHHRSLFQAHGHFDERFKIAGDYELLLRELRDHEAWFMPDLILAGMQQGGISSDPLQSLQLLQEERLAHEKLLGGRCGWLWYAAYLRVRIRQALWWVLGERAARVVLDALRMAIGKPRYWTKTG